jgi:hypothetical protein
MYKTLMISGIYIVILSVRPLLGKTPGRHDIVKRASYSEDNNDTQPRIRRYNPPIALTFFCGKGELIATSVSSFSSGLGPSRDSHDEPHTCSQRAAEEPRCSSNS